MTSKDRAATAEEFKDFVYSVSHDLGAPIRAMVEFSRLLREEEAGLLSQDGKLYLSLIVENGEKLQQMLDALLLFSRVSMSAKPFAVVDCQEICRQAAGQLDINAALPKGEIVIGPLPPVSGDRDQLRLLFSILLENARTYHAKEAPPHIAVTAEKEDRHWVFRICDKGIGIAAKYHKLIFQTFFRLHTDKQYPGIGMGLAVAAKIVERHGGKIWVESAEGAGACFCFTLPEETKAA